MAVDQKNILKDVEELGVVEKIITESNILESPEEIHYRCWINPTRCLKNEIIDAITYFSDLKTELESLRDDWTKNLEFGSLITFFSCR